MDTWESLQTAWQSAPATTIDVPALRNQSQRKRSRMLRYGVLEILLALAFTVLIAVAGLPANLHAGPLLPWLFLAAAWIEVLLKTWLRLASWNVKNLGTAGLLELHVRRARAGIAYAWTSIIAVLVGIGLWAPILWHQWLSPDPAMHDAVVPTVVGIGIIFALLIAWPTQCALGQRRKLHHARALLRQLADEG
jgi:hypothetical protein